MSMMIKDLYKFNMELYLFRSSLISILSEIPTGKYTVKMAGLKKNIESCEDAEVLIRYGVEVLKLIKGGI